MRKIILMFLITFTLVVPAQAGDNKLEDYARIGAVIFKGAKAAGQYKLASREQRAKDEARRRHDALRKQAWEDKTELEHVKLSAKMQAMQAAQMHEMRMRQAEEAHQARMEAIRNQRYRRPAKTEAEKLEEELRAAKVRIKLLEAKAAEQEMEKRLKEKEDSE
ncbi:MAG: hypothetical protein MRY49_01905 [Candidatus Pacebacteria bacterium]|nr:hypothetical protein [Candidatus Paceibacterota bacterium]